MSDPTLAARLSSLTVPTLVLWGASDQIVDADYGRAYAQAIPTARLRTPHRDRAFPPTGDPGAGTEGAQRQGIPLDRRRRLTRPPSAAGERLCAAATAIRSGYRLSSALRGGQVLGSSSPSA